MTTATDITTVTIVHGKQAAENYPYGYNLRTTQYYWVEFKKGKGYRGVTQTINPKNGKLNAPKASTYSSFVYIVQENETGHFKFRHVAVKYVRDFEKFADFLATNRGVFTFTETESQEFWASIITGIRIELHFLTLKEGQTIEDVRAAVKLDAIMEAYKTKEDIYKFAEIGFKAADLNEVTESNPVTFAPVQY